MTLDLPVHKPNQFNVLLGVTGSVATIKVGELVQRLQTLTVLSSGVEKHVKVVVVGTEKGMHFVELSEHRLSPDVMVYQDRDEWSWKSRTDPVLHVELRKWADLMLIAPLDANTLAKLSHGICDNLLTCVCRAWDSSKPLLFAPAMNTMMYEHPLTSRQIKLLVEELGYLHIPAIEKTLVCGDSGVGAMATLEQIVDAVLGTVS